MTTEEWHKVKEVLQTALELDPGARRFPGFRVPAQGFLSRLVAFGGGFDPHRLLQIIASGFRDRRSSQNSRNASVPDVASLPGLSGINGIPKKESA